MIDGLGLLRRKAQAATRATPAPAGQPTATRALRQGFARAAADGAGLPLAVLGVALDVAPLDDLLARLEPGLLLLRVERGGVAAGLLALDAEARAALAEAQLLGRPGPQPAEPRPPTAADAALCAPVATAFLREMGTGAEGTPLAGWAAGAVVGAPFATAAEAGLALPDGGYRAARLTLDLGAGGRQGLALLLLPVALRPGAPSPDAGAADAAWRDHLAERVMGAPAVVTAVLHRLRLSLAAAEGLEVGQVLPLPGVTVGSVRLEGPDAADLGPARLGQVAGMRAVRIEAPGPAALAEMATPPRIAPLGGG